tara:strand:- start:17105 stop:18298 length:1194 start_codon:yes stop_codon:yes gene_type:complete
MSKMVLSGKGRRWLQKGHPWVYSDDVADGMGQPGELLPVEDPNGEPLGWALFSASSRIALRMVTRDAEQPTREFWLGRVARAIQVRAKHDLLDPEGACRLIAGDSDGLPGFIADRYRDVIVLQCSTQSADRMRDFLIELIEEAMPFPIRTVVDRSDVAVRRFEGLETRVETVKGDEPDPIIVHEPGGLQFEVDVLSGHKTGAYLDQRDNRIRTAELVRGRRVLDAFAYDGLFGIRAAMAGAEEVVCLEQNAAACERIRANAERNGVSDKVKIERVNCMQDLRNRADANERYGVVVLDPPAFARNKKELEGAERGYVELNRRAASLLEPGGDLISASCSYAAKTESFVRWIGIGTRLAGRESWLESLHGAAPDHPYRIELPESQYLKCAFVRLDGDGA